MALIHGSLQHVTVVYLQGRSHLTPLSSFLSKFPNEHVLHNIPIPCLRLLSWWASALAIPNPTCTLVELPKRDLDIWVDTSTSWGLGLCIGNKWASWCLLEGWDCNGRDIGWAETIALELAVLWLTQSGWHDCSLKIHCDNTSIIAYFWKGHSRNPSRNDSLARSTSCLTASNISICPTYVQSSLNRANPFSRGLSGDEGCCVIPNIVLPIELSRFIESV